MRHTDAWAASLRTRGVLALAAALAAIGCTLDYDQFSIADSGAATSGGGILSTSSSFGTGSAMSSGGNGNGGAIAVSSASAGGIGGAGGKGTGGAGGNPSCAPDEKACGGACVKLVDPAFGCAPDGCAPCALANASVVCEGGACGIGACNSGFANCDGNAQNGCEAEPSVNPDNCGGCGSTCVVPNAKAACVASKCVVATCSAGFKDCNALPVDGCETNVDGDPHHCGTCFTSCAAVTQICQSGACTASSCPVGLGDCDGNSANGCETNLTISTTSCGFCGNACNLAHANATCTGGACAIGSCVGTFANCDGLATNGCEVDLSISTAHCGNCGIQCPAFLPNGTPTCAAGTCAVVCNAGFADCNGKVADGCEVATSTNASNCGACGAGCPIVNDTPICGAGICKVGGCALGFADCDGKVGNGCEVTLGSPLACASCNDACPSPAHATATCSGGICGFICDAEFADCDGDPSNGCEASLSDPTSCGSCLKVCSVENGVAGCSAGACTIASCTSPFEDCDGLVGDGCESDATQDPMHCGGCNTACTVANGTPTCSGGACAVASCALGYSDCDKMYMNGCESANATDPANCGGCGMGCAAPPHATAGCAMGICAVGTCAPLFGDCNGKVADGCEMSVANDVANCGACGRACARNNVSSIDCKAGLCDSACKNGFGNCGLPAAPTADDGCEMDVTQSDDHCGSCANSCATEGTLPANPFVCDGNGRPKGTCGCSSDAACGVAPGTTCDVASGICTCSNGGCKQGEACNGGNCSCNEGAACANGQSCCEAGCKALNNDAQNCGACGHVCPDNFVCNGGACECNNNSDCLFGGSVCFMGACHCSVISPACGGGERCVANGTCG